MKKNTLYIGITGLLTSFVISIGFIGYIKYKEKEKVRSFAKEFASTINDKDQRSDFENIMVHQQNSSHNIDIDREALENVFEILDRSHQKKEPGGNWLTSQMAYQILDKAIVSKEIGQEDFVERELLRRLNSPEYSKESWSICSILPILKKRGSKNDEKIRSYTSDVRDDVQRVSQRLLGVQ
jgi:hypothetical protein